MKSRGVLPPLFAYTNKDNPCNGCTERTGHCHATCERLIGSMAKRKAMMDEVNQKKKVEHDLNDYRTQVVLRVTDKMKKVQ